MAGVEHSRIVLYDSGRHYNFCSFGNLGHSYTGVLWFLCFPLRFYRSCRPTLTCIPLGKLTHRFQLIILRNTRQFVISGVVASNRISHLFLELLDTGQVLLPFVFFCGHRFKHFLVGVESQVVLLFRYLLRVIFVSKGALIKLNAI